MGGHNFETIEMHPLSFLFRKPHLPGGASYPQNGETNITLLGDSY